MRNVTVNRKQEHTAVLPKCDLILVKLMHCLKNLPEIHQLIEGGMAQELGHAFLLAMTFLSNGGSDVCLLCQLLTLCMGQRTFALQMSLPHIWLFCIPLRFFLGAIATRAARGVDCDISEKLPHS